MTTNRMARCVAFMLIFLMIPLLFPAIGHGLSGHRLSIRNFTDETVEVEIIPFDDFADGDTLFLLDPGRCDDQTLLFFETGFCDYQLCAFGAVTGFNYGCVENRSCAGIDIIFYEEFLPEIGDFDSCPDDCDHDDCIIVDDDLDSDVSVNCFLKTAASGAVGTPSISFRMFQMLEEILRRIAFLVGTISIFLVLFAFLTRIGRKGAPP